MGINGVRVLATNVYIDSRGDFVKTFSLAQEPHFEKFDIAETFYSSTFEGAARGMHLQIGEGASNRFISCVQGRIYDVLIDLRTHSETFMNIETITMGPGAVQSIYVPAGVAHGFVALENSITHYISDQPHNPTQDKGVHLESLGIHLPFANLILSQRDQELPSLESWLDSEK